MMTTDWFEGQQSNGLYVTMANISARGGKYDGDSDVAIEIIIHMIVNIFMDKIAC